MKKQNLLLAVLAIPMLASCGAKSSTKKPHNLVKYDEFLEKVQEEVAENELFGMKEGQEAFSYELKMQENTKIDFKYLKQGKTLYKEKENYSDKTVVRFDSKKHIIAGMNQVKIVDNSAEYTELEEEKISFTVESLYDSEILAVEPEIHAYSKTKVEEADKAVDSLALMLIGTTADLLEGAFYPSEHTKYYVDKKVFTVVVDEDVTENGESYVEKTTYQLAIKKNSYSFVMNQEISDIDSEREKHVESHSTATFAKKKVSLKHANVEKFVEKTEGLDLF